MSAVLLYHLWPGRLPGGFVGVDVFFVISGFLIGSHLLAEVDATGGVRLGRFWARRARRLLPASLLVLAVVTVATLVVSPLSTRAGFLDQVVGSTLYVQNWVLAAQSVDYLHSDDAVSPVQHYWSLSTEEQFYVALPLVVAAVAVLVRGRARHRVTTLVLLGLGVASLVTSVVLTRTDPGLAYFSTATRAWEFLAGVVLASLALRPGRRLRTALGTVGLAAVVASSVLLSDASPFPGALAAVPVGGALLLVAAADAGPLAAASRWRPVTWLGDVSYAVYLWHWPLVVLLPQATGHPLRTAERLGILVATLVLAQLSTRLVEDPVRRASARAPRRARAVVTACVVASLVVAGTAVAGARHSTGEQRELQARAATVLDGDGARCLGAAAMDPEVTGCPDLGDLLVPAPAAAALDDGNRADCWATQGVTELRTCALGPPAESATRRVLAVGDSHNAMLVPAYEELADELGWHVDVAGRSDCTWGSRPQQARTQELQDECTTWKQAVADHLQAGAPYDVIVTVGLRSGFPAVPHEGETASEASVESLTSAWSEQVARGTTVVAIDDTPAARHDVVQCVERLGEDAASGCAQPLGKAFVGIDAPRAAVAQVPGSALVDLRDLLCEQECAPVVGHVVVYRDRTHLTGTFARTLAPYLVERVQDAVRQARSSR